jgi:isopentenyl-diphosphate delta-isomerase
MAIVGENPELFESRKADHIRLALDESMQASGGSGFERIRLVHEAFPEIDFSEIDLSTTLLSKPSSLPLFISSMTAGHAGSVNLNLILARVSEKRNWAMGVGSQRRQLTDPSVDQEWTKIRKQCPNVRFFGNIGLAQLIRSRVADIQRLAETLRAEAMIVHANPLQECMQPEGTPQFRGGFKALETLVNEIGLPVIVKETGCGFSQATLKRLSGLGVAAVDVSGFGGTHWGRIEGGRSKDGDLRKRASQTFADWGMSTVDSLSAAVEVKPDYEVWASGGVRSGLDAAKCFALGARMVGIAKPLIEAALIGEAALDACMGQFEYELKTAMFCTGSRTLNELQEKKVWEWAPKL